MAEANGYFFNVTSLGIKLIVNGDSGTTMTPVKTAPYENPASKAYPRVTGEPRQGELGRTNTIIYQMGENGLQGTITVTVVVDRDIYGGKVDLILYLFESAVVVLATSDTRPYMGKNGDTIVLGKETSLLA